MHILDHLMQSDNIFPLEIGDAMLANAAGKKEFWRSLCAGGRLAHLTLSLAARSLSSSYITTARRARLSPSLLPERLARLLARTHPAAAACLFPSCLHYY